MDKVKMEINRFLERNGFIAEWEAKGQKEGRTEIIDLLRQGMQPADIIAKYGQ